MGRHSRARHSESAPRHWSHVLAGVPWITLVLLVVLGLGALELSRPRTYLATATLTATTERAADQVSVRLTDPALRTATERAIELDPELVGSVGLQVRHDTRDPQVHLEAQAPDPRLAAVAADTAAALVVQERDDGTRLSETARVPTEPQGERGLTWLVVAAAALALAVRIEGAHRIWMREHPAPEPVGAA